MMRLPRFRFAGSYWLPVCSLLLANGVEALEISPVMIELSSRQRVASVQLHNDSTEPLMFQTEILKWQQVGDKDIYDPTQDLLVTPPIAVIEAGASQIFRIALRSPAVNDGERAYRLYVEDVTEATSTQPGVVKVRFNHNLPVFVTPSGELKADPRWSLCAAPPGKGCVRLDNHGSRRMRFSELTAVGEGWQQVVHKGGANNVLRKQPTML